MILIGMLEERLAFALTPAVVLEYEDVLKRPAMMGTRHKLGLDDVDTVLDELCYVAYWAKPWFRFRPFVNDPKDDHVIECAFAANARHIVSDDKGSDIPIVKDFGIIPMKAANFAQWAREEGLI